MALVAGFFGTQKEVVVSVDDRSLVVKTHLDNVGAILRDTSIAVRPGDIVIPPPSSSLSNAKSIVIVRSKPVVVHADGSDYSFRTQAKSVAEAVRESGIELRREDSVYLDSEQAPQDAELMARGASVATGDATARTHERGNTVALSARSGDRDPTATPNGEGKPIEITVARAVPIFIHDGETFGAIYTSRKTLGEALAGQGVTIYGEDLVSPPLATQITANMHVYVLRARPITIKVDGRTMQVRTQAKTIEEAILQQGVKLVGKDRIEPPRETPVESNVVVRVTRVKEDVITEQETIDFAVEYRADPGIELDEVRLTQEGKAGLRKWQTRIVYENGEEVSRTVEKRWVESQPVNRVFSYGAKIVVRELETPGGMVNYWRKFRMWATSYNASGGGKSPDHPAYGITRLGMKVTRGVVAIDPSVIPFYTRVYVPGYGDGLAADTGGGIRGKMIDLGFDETDVNLWSARWTDVYLLTPVPPASEIRYRMFD